MQDLKTTSQHYNVPTLIGLLKYKANKPHANLCGYSLHMAFVTKWVRKTNTALCLSGTLMSKLMFCSTICMIRGFSELSPVPSVTLHNESVRYKSFCNTFFFFFYELSTFRRNIHVCLYKRHIKDYFIISPGKCPCATR